MRSSFFASVEVIIIIVIIVIIIILIIVTCTGETNFHAEKI
jgi:competence protein ComGC